jgi:hypothetical protein
MQMHLNTSVYAIGAPEMGGKPSFSAPSPDFKNKHWEKQGNIPGPNINTIKISFKNYIQRRALHDRGIGFISRQG